jgi:hypothetical protein
MERTLEGTYLELWTSQTQEDISVSNFQCSNLSLALADPDCKSNYGDAEPSYGGVDLSPAAEVGHRLIGICFPDIGQKHRWKKDLCSASFADY